MVDGVAQSYIADLAYLGPEYYMQNCKIVTVSSIKP